MQLYILLNINNKNSLKINSYIIKVDVEIKTN